MPEPIDVVEALLFASDTPVEAARIQEVLDLESAGRRARARAGAPRGGSTSRAACCRSSRWAAASAS